MITAKCDHIYHLCEVTSFREDLNYVEMLWSPETEKRLNVLLEFY